MPIIVPNVRLRLKDVYKRQGYGTSFSWTVNNDSWKKIRNFFTGQKDDEEQGQDQNASTEEDSSIVENFNGVDVLWILLRTF